MNNHINIFSVFNRTYTEYFLYVNNTDTAQFNEDLENQLLNRGRS